MNERGIIQGVELFYLVMVSIASCWAATYVIRIWLKNQSKSVSTQLGILFALLIIVSFGIPALFRLMMITAPTLFSRTSLSGTIFKIISLFNNLWLILFANHIRQKEESEEGTAARWKKIILFSLIIMTGIAIEPVAFNQIPLGRYILIGTDTAISLLAIITFSRSVHAYLKSSPSFPIFRSLIVFVQIILPLLIVSSLFTFLLDTINQQRPSVSVLAILLGLYLICILIIYALLLAITHPFSTVSQPSVVKADQSNVGEQLNDGEWTDQTAGEQPVKTSIHPDLIPAQLQIDYDAQTMQFSLVMQCSVGDLKQPTVFTWKGDKCPYPFFHWIYLSVAAINQLKVELKNAQVSRNKMCALLHPQLKSKNFITIWGITASLNLNPENIHITPHLLDNNAVKLKFMDNLESFFELIEHDTERLERDRRYANEVSEEVYDVLRKSIRQQHNAQSKSS
jgi:hypothetical protein